MADFERDYVMRVIRDMVRFISTVVFGRTDLMVGIDSTTKAEVGTVPPSVSMYTELLRMVEHGDINDAEDMLYEQIDTSDIGYLEAGLAFYHRLTDISDRELEASNYSREEILDGIHELSEMFGIDGLDQFQ